MRELKYTRGDIVQRLRKTIAAGRPILGAGSSAGIIAKCAELGGADLIIAYSSGRYRIMGLPTAHYGDSNAITLEMAHEILNVVRDTPVVGGVQASDAKWIDLSQLLDKFIDAGYTGLINFWTVTMFAEERKLQDGKGFGFNRELEMTKLAHERDMFTMGYVFNPEDAAAMAEHGADCIVAHVGATAGGLAGAKVDKSLKEAAQEAQSIIDAAKRVNPEIICLAHGGPFVAPEDTVYLYEHTQAAGFVGASSIERIPVEKAVIDVVKQFKGVPIKARL